MSTPYDTRTVYQPRTTPGTDGLLRDVAAVLVMVLGVAAVIYGAFLIGDAAGWIVTGTLLILAGVALGYRRR